MSWSAGNNNPGPFGRWEDWGRGPAPGPGVDRVSGGPFAFFPYGDAYPGSPQEIFGSMFQHGGPFAGCQWAGGSWGGRRGGRHGPHHPRGGRASRGPAGDAAEGSSARDPPDTGVTGDPDISTPDQLNDEPDSPGTATPGPSPFGHAGPPPYSFPFPPGPPHGPPPHGPPPPGPPHGHPHHHRGGPSRGAHGPHRGGRRGPHPHPHEAPVHPWAQRLQNLAESFFPGAAAGASAPAAADDGSRPFTPPLDLFATPAAYVLHIALPGAKKSDIGVDWDPDTSHIRVAGVIHRPGDEALLASLLPTSAERRVGYFERLVKLPPPETAEQARRWRDRRPPQPPRGQDVDGHHRDDDADGDDNDLMDVEEEGREEIDAAGITAKMEDGVLIVTVPKVERGWTEVTKVDIE